MKTVIVAFLLLLSVVTAFATGFPFKPNEGLRFPLKRDEANTFLQTLVSAENDDEDMGDDDSDGDKEMATLQAVFNVLAQVELEKAKMKRDKATIQLLGLALKGLWNVGKHFLKKKYCTEEQKVQAMIQELASEQQMHDEDSDDTEEGADGKARVEIQSLFNALKVVEAKAMQDSTGDYDHAVVQKWWKKVKRWINKKVGGLTRKFLC